MARGEPWTGAPDRVEAFAATDDLLEAGALRQDGRRAEALDLVCGARAILGRHLPPGDPTLCTVDRTISDLRAEMAAAADR